MTFDWSVSFGTLLSTLTLLTIGFFGAWRIVANHLTCMERRLTKQLEDLGHRLGTCERVLMERDH